MVFRGITDHLIPLFAVGAFLAFTLSQTGMVMHWWRNKKSEGKRARRNLLVNGLGAARSLLRRGGPRMVVIGVPWRLKD